MNTDDFTTPRVGHVPHDSEHPTGEWNGALRVDVTNSVPAARSWPADFYKPLHAPADETLALLDAMVVAATSARDSYVREQAFRREGPSGLHAATECHAEVIRWVSALDDAMDEGPIQALLDCRPFGYVAGVDHDSGTVTIDTKPPHPQPVVVLDRNAPGGVICRPCLARFMGCEVHEIGAKHAEMLRDSHAPSPDGPNHLLPPALQQEYEADLAETTRLLTACRQHSKLHCDICERRVDEAIAAFNTSRRA